MRLSAALLLCSLACATKAAAGACTASHMLVGSVGYLSMSARLLRGRVEVLDDCTFGAQHLELAPAARGSGAAVATVWWGAAGTSEAQVKMGRSLAPAAPLASPHGYNGTTPAWLNVSLDAGAGVTWAGIGAVGVAEVDASTGAFVRSLGVAALHAAGSAGAAAAALGGTYFDHCIAPAARFRIRWSLVKDPQTGEDALDIGLEGIVPANAWLGFGPGAPLVVNRLMGGADVAVGGVRAGTPFVVDAYISNYEQCNYGNLESPRGTCEDYTWAGGVKWEVDEPKGPKRSNVQLVSAAVLEGVTSVRLRRPIETIDEKWDHDIQPFNPQHFIWAYGATGHGPKDPPQVAGWKGPALLYHGPREDVQFGEVTSLRLADAAFACPLLPAAALDGGNAADAVNRLERVDADGFEERYSKVAMLEAGGGGSNTAGGAAASSGTKATLFWDYNEALRDLRMGVRIVPPASEVTTVDVSASSSSSSSSSSAASAAGEALGVDSGIRSTMGWASIGIGHSMSAAVSYVAWVEVDAATGIATPRVDEYLMDGIDALSVKPTAAPLRLTNVQLRRDGGISFEVWRSVPANGIIAGADVTLSEPAPFIWAWGPTWRNQPDEIDLHTERSNTATVVDLETGAVSSAGLNWWLIVHVAGMTLAWVAIVPVSVLVARYARTMRPRSHLPPWLRRPMAWLGWHRNATWLATAAAAVALLCVIIEASINGGRHLLSLHSQLAVAPLVLMALQIAVGLNKPRIVPVSGPTSASYSAAPSGAGAPAASDDAATTAAAAAAGRDSGSGSGRGSGGAAGGAAYCGLGRRAAWGWGHRLVGWSSMALAIAAIITGIDEVQRHGAGDTGRWVAGAIVWLSLLLAVAGHQEWRRRCSRDAYKPLRTAASSSAMRGSTRSGAGGAGGGAGADGGGGGDEGGIELASTSATRAPTAATTGTAASGTGTGAAAPAIITLAELATHSAPRDGWIAVSGRVWDVSRFLDEHPGGADTIEDVLGTEATEAFEAAHAYVDPASSDQNGGGLVTLVGVLEGSRPAIAAAAAAAEAEAEAEAAAAAAADAGPRKGAGAAASDGGMGDGSMGDGAARGAPEKRQWWWDAVPAALAVAALFLGLWAGRVFDGSDVNQSQDMPAHRDRPVYLPDRSGGLFVDWRIRTNTSARINGTLATNSYGCIAYPARNVGDGWCDDHEPFNTAVCKWDGGDCCDVKAGGHYNCRDPTHANYGKSSPKGFHVWDNGNVAARNPRYQELVKPPRQITSWAAIINYNNYYEFTTSKNVWSTTDSLSATSKAYYEASNWEIEITGAVARPMKVKVSDLVDMLLIEERVLRHRCVEAWSMVMPWAGFPLAALLDLVQPKATATFVEFTTFNFDFDTSRYYAPGMNPEFPWPYTEALTMEEAYNELTFMAVGVSQKPLTLQSGMPIRLVLPWKYGFASIKGPVKIEVLEGRTTIAQRPKGFWERINAHEYGFWAVVNPSVPHPRWSQSQEGFIKDHSLKRELIPTEIYNGYSAYVSYMYSDHNNKADPLYK